jgi:mevalonate kinase
MEVPKAIKQEQAQVLKRAFESASQSIRSIPVSVRVKSDLPIGMGLGSSAALSVAVARVLLKANHLDPKLAKVLNLAAIMEGEFHGTPSGVDHTTSARGEILLYQRGGPIRRIKPGRPLRMVVALSGPRPPTVAALKERRTRWHSRYLRLFQEIGALAVEGARAIKRGDWLELGDLMNVNHGLLWSMQLSSERIDRVVRQMRRLGAHGAKLTGAGGDGGAVIGLFDDASVAVRGLTRLGIECFETRL